MRRGLRLATYAVVGIALVGVSGFSAALGVSSSKVNRKYDVTLTTVVVPTDEESKAWGSHLVNSVTGCQDCHGANLEGTVISDDAAVRIAAPNLTRGRGGIAAGFTDADWVRAIRHGVQRDGRSLIIMPSYAYAHLSDRDLGAMIAYLKQLPPIDNELPQFRLRPLGRALTAIGAFDEEFVAKKVPHRDSYAAVEAGMTTEYGSYLASISGCTSCHRADLKGGPGGPPGTPPAADISAAALASWNRDDFLRLMREGRRPDGVQISDFMPWRVMGTMTDDELDAIWLFLTSHKAD
jgi:cytochrome c553